MYVCVCVCVCVYHRCPQVVQEQYSEYTAFLHLQKVWVLVCARLWVLVRASYSGTHTHTHTYT